MCRSRYGVIFQCKFFTLFLFFRFLCCGRKIRQVQKSVNFCTCQTPEASDIRVGFIYSWVIMPINDSKWGLLLKMTTILIARLRKCSVNIESIPVSIQKFKIILILKRKVYVCVCVCVLHVYIVYWFPIIRLLSKLSLTNTGIFPRRTSVMVSLIRAIRS